MLQSSKSILAFDVFTTMMKIANAFTVVDRLDMSVVRAQVS